MKKNHRKTHCRGEEEWDREGEIKEGCRGNKFLQDKREDECGENY